MKTARSLFWKAAGGCAVLAAAAATLLIRSRPDPIVLARALTGLDLPTGTAVLSDERSWGDFLPDGHSTFVLQIPEGFGDEVLSNCGVHGFRPGSLEEAGIRIPSFEQEMAQESPVCHRVRYASGQLDVAVIARTKLAVYVGD